MTLGLYDIDFHHGTNFSISLPLMKAYERFLGEGHQVIMMDAYEKTGRYNKIFYFKDNPCLRVPNGLTLNTEKGKMLGYGFYGKSGLENQKTIDATPNFTPYELFSSKIKNKNKFNSIKVNSLIDWREKDFTGARMGAGITYVNDRDFLLEPDWLDLINHFDNNIEFIHTIRPTNFVTAEEFINTYHTSQTKIVLPFTLNPQHIKNFSGWQWMSFDIKDVSNEDLFFFIFAAKIMGIEGLFFDPPFSNDPFKSNLLKWGRSNEMISYQEFLKDVFKDSDYYKLSYRILLKQNPQKITLKDIADKLTFS